MVLITAYASLPTSIEALRLGAADYLTKPINIKQLSRYAAEFSFQRNNPSFYDVV